MTSPFLKVLENMIESRDDVNDADDDDNNDLQSTGENCDSEGESSSDEDCFKLHFIHSSGTLHLKMTFDPNPSK